MTPGKWFKYVLLILLGLSLPFMAYKISEAYNEDAYIQEHSPRIKMPVVNRIKGWGTIRYPNKIYVRYRGKTYTLESSNKYFRSTANLDSIDVHYDPMLDSAVRANGKINKPHVLLTLIALGGLVAIIGTVVDLRRQLMKRVGG